MRNIMRPKAKRKPKFRFGCVIRNFFIMLFSLVCGISILAMLVLKYQDPPTSSFIELNRANHNQNIQHVWVPFEQISLYFPNAIVAAEDQRFPEHFGFDVAQIKLAIEQNKKAGKARRGASTITQQTVKNLFLWPERSFARKAIEAWLTFWMELTLSKKRILELYMNFAQFGKSIFGIEAASQHYFNIPASQLSPHQAALIAASLPTPSRSNPAEPSEYLLERAAFIEDQMPRIGGRRAISELQ